MGDLGKKLGGVVGCTTPGGRHLAMPNPQPITVLHIHTNRRWGGGEQQILALVAASEAHGVRSILVARPSGELFRRVAVEVPDCTLVPFEFFSHYNPVTVARVCRVLRRTRPGLLHLHDSAGAYLGVGAATVLGDLPVVLHRRISSPVRRNPFSRAVYRARCIETYIAVSESARKSLLGADVHERRTLVIPSGVDTVRLTPPEDRASLRRELGLEAAPWIGTVGSLEAKKDVETFVRGARHLAEREPLSRFLIVGDGPERGRLERLAGEFGLCDRLRFTGHVPDAHRYLAALDLFVFPSLREGSPGVIKEAMALGVPIVAAAAPGTVEVVCDATASLIPPGRPEEFAQGILELLMDPVGRSEMAARARVRVKDRFPIDSTVRAVTECYRSILNPVPATVVPPDRAAASRSA